MKTGLKTTDWLKGYLGSLESHFTIFLPSVLLTLKVRVLLSSARKSAAAAGLRTGRYQVKSKRAKPQATREWQSPAFLASQAPSGSSVSRQRRKHSASVKGLCLTLGERAGQQASSCAPGHQVKFFFFVPGFYT